MAAKKCCSTHGHCASIQHWAPTTAELPFLFLPFSSSSFIIGLHFSLRKSRKKGWTVLHSCLHTCTHTLHLPLDPSSHFRFIFDKSSLLLWVSEGDEKCCCCRCCFFITSFEPINGQFVFFSFSFRSIYHPSSVQSVCVHRRKELCFCPVSVLY